MLSLHGWKLAVGVLALTLVPALASAQNIVQDPGFESANAGAGEMLYTAPDFIGDGVWQVTQNSILVVNNSVTSNSQSHGGTQYVSMTPNADVSTLSQTLSTTPGATYTLSFFAASNDPPNTFGVTFGGMTVPGIPTTLPDTSSSGILPSSSYVEYTATGLLASSASTVLAFSASNPPGATLLDDVSVIQTSAAVPEPGSLALLFGLGVTGVGFLRRKRAR